MRAREGQGVIGDICSKPAITVSPESTVHEAAHRMLTRRVGALVVVTRTGKPVGVVTDRDLTVGVTAHGKDPAVVRVGTLIQRRLTTIREDAGVLEATRLMSRRGVRRLPVVSRTGRLVGILALDDLLILLGSELGHVASTLASELGRPRL
jgi:CBS domain-containing protein